MFTQWQNHQPVEFTCVNKHIETKNTVSIFLKPSDPMDIAPIYFKSGQCVTLGVTIEGKTHYRAYSITSLSGSTELQLTIKRVPNGKVSNYVFDHVNIGDALQVLAPSGSFNLVDNPPQASHKKIAFISAGCGITPVYSMARDCLSQSETNDIVFLHIAPNPEEVLFLPTLETWAQQNRHFHLTLLLKDAQNSLYAQGRLDQNSLNQLIPNIAEYTLYLCGPEGFMSDVKTYFSALGGDLMHCHSEVFQENKPLADEPKTANQRNSVRVSIENSGVNLEAEMGDTLADVLEDADLPILLACRSGVCGACKCKVTKGEVNVLKDDGLTPSDKEQGYVLACSSTLISDIEVALP